MTLSAGANLAEIAALVGDPGRANMLAAMSGGRPLAASELADIAGVTAATASGHLARLAEGGLVSVEARGRQRLFRLATPQVAHMLESLMVVAAAGERPPRATPRTPPHLRDARTCYDHLAGRLGAGLADSLSAMGAISLSSRGAEVLPGGAAILARLQLEPPVVRGARRPLCRACLDWSEQRFHVGGALGQTLLQRLLQLGWIEPGPRPREILVSTAGRRGVKQSFALDL